MPSNLSIKGLGLSLSAALAVPYVLIMLASLLMVGWFTTGSWPAVFLGIGWSTIAGFEIGPPGGPDRRLCCRGGGAHLQRRPATTDESTKDPGATEPTRWAIGPVMGIQTAYRMLCAARSEPRRTARVSAGLILWRDTW